MMMTPREAARILLRARQALLLGAFVLTGVWAWRGQGLFRLFTDTQVRWTGGYDASFALLFTFLTLFVASMALGSVLTGVMRRRFSKEEWQILLRDTTTLWDGPWRPTKAADSRTREIADRGDDGDRDEKVDAE